MYSVVLMLAMSTAPEAVEFGKRGGCYGGCYSASCTGCTGCTGVASCGGCSGTVIVSYGCTGSSSCYGGWGSYHGTFVRRHFHHKVGCWSSCHGVASCTGCYGSCYSSCHGCSGCTGYAIPVTSCTGCSGSIYYPSTGCNGCVGSGSCYGSYFNPQVIGGGGCYGYGMPQVIAPSASYVPTISGYTPGIPVEAAPAVPAAPAAEPKKDEKKEGTFRPASPNKAAVIVRLPADAKLYADGQLTQLNSAERRFYTPELEPGRDYHYNMKVEYVRDGKTVTDTKVVNVRAGEAFNVEFTDLTRVAKAPRQPELVKTQVTVKLPNNAKLFVDGEASPLTNDTRVFHTPNLPKGEEFFYVFRAEIVRDGKTDSRTQQVSFRAGEAVEVRFEDMGSDVAAK